jgi:RNA polymerase sigma-70 factor (ECF subfamily)
MKRQPGRAARLNGNPTRAASHLLKRREIAMQNAEQLYCRYRSQLLGFIQQHVGDRDLAQDILHDVFVKIIGRHESLREPGKITAWLYQVTRNAIIDRLRSSRLHEELPQEIAGNEDGPSAEIRLAGFLRPMIDTLPQIYRDAVTLSDLEGVPLKQIAGREGITVSATKSRVQRGRRLLETMLHDCCTFEISRRGDITDFWPKAHSGCRCHVAKNASLSFVSTVVAKAASQ